MVEIICLLAAGLYLGISALRAAERRGLNVKAARSYLTFWMVFDALFFGFSLFMAGLKVGEHMAGQ